MSFDPMSLIATTTLSDLSASGGGGEGKSVPAGGPEASRFSELMRRAETPTDVTRDATAAAARSAPMATTAALSVSASLPAAPTMPTGEAAPLPMPVSVPAPALQVPVSGTLSTPIADEALPAEAALGVQTPSGGPQTDPVVDPAGPLMSASVIQTDQAAVPSPNIEAEVTENPVAQGASVTPASNPVPVSVPTPTPTPTQSPTSARIAQPLPQAQPQPTPKITSAQSEVVADGLPLDTAGVRPDTAVVAPVDAPEAGLAAEAATAALKTQVETSNLQSVTTASPPLATAIEAWAAAVIPVPQGDPAKTPTPPMAQVTPPLLPQDRPQPQTALPAAPEAKASPELKAQPESLKPNHGRVEEGRSESGRASLEVAPDAAVSSKTNSSAAPQSADPSQQVMKALGRQIASQQPSSQPAPASSGAVIVATDTPSAPPTQTTAYTSAGTAAVPAQSAPVPTASLPLSYMSPEAAQNLRAVSANIQKSLKDGNTHFSIELHPAHMGRVDVNLRIDAQGRVMAELIFDKTAVADDFSNRQDDLRQQLSQAGLKLEADGLTFRSREADLMARDNGHQNQSAFDQQQAQQNDRHNRQAERAAAALRQTQTATTDPELNLLNAALSDATASKGRLALNMIV